MPTLALSVYNMQQHTTCNSKGASVSGFNQFSRLCHPGGLEADKVYLAILPATKVGSTVQYMPSGEENQVVSQGSAGGPQVIPLSFDEVWLTQPVVFALR